MPVVATALVSPAVVQTLPGVLAKSWSLVIVILADEAVTALPGQTATAQEPKITGGVFDGPWAPLSRPRRPPAPLVVTVIAPLADSTAVPTRLMPLAPLPVIEMPPLPVA